MTTINIYRNDVWAGTGSVERPDGTYTWTLEEVSR